MKKALASALLATVVSVSAVPAVFADTAITAKSSSFIDIDKSYAKSAIEELHGKGILSGVDNEGRFDPKGSLTRAQFVTIIVNALGLPADATTSSFTDVKAAWAVKYVEAAYKAGIVNGVGNNKFAPNEPVTREMAAAILVNALKTEGKLDDANAAVNFKDGGKIATWFQASIGVAQKYQLIAGYPDGTFDPKTTANREMGAVMGSNLLKAIEVVVKENTPAPVAISGVHIESSNENAGRAKVGDTVTLKFTTTEHVSKLGNFKINGSNPTTFVSEGSGSAWTNTATYVLEDSDSEGVVNFQINVKNDAGIYSVTTEATSDGSTVTVFKKPEISSVSLASNNADPSKATVGDVVTLTFTTKQQVSKLGNFKINGGNPASFTSTEQADHTWKNAATYTIDPTDPKAAMNFQINVKNAVGLYSVTTETTTDGSSVTVY
ncbi:S-layer homology domain-containing protein [Cohnella candidum]|uniref:S-layer homology domain-containing protein n=1 Tax=Cohnella candidum TaxID=2674991 RepID=A0A3G3K3X8_9BACL|nr:S-layer homology domain-containing protein [Cohnella candidum]AYQ75193.1 S-layer homology domain-containing protein [Cohnella candidum]